jgi:hypothetical protein
MSRLPSALLGRVAAMSARRQLAVGAAVLFVLRLALTAPRSGPVVVADEIGYLTNARVLAGGAAGQMSTAPFYHGGYSLLLAPVLALDGNPNTSYHLVLALNAILAASLVPLVYLLLTRCFDVPSRAAVWPSLAAAAYPSVTIYTQVAMSENLLLPLFTFWLLAVGCFLRAANDARRFAWGAAAAAGAVWLWATHGRMLVVVALTIAVFGASLARRRSAARPALLGLAVVAVGLVAVHVLDDFLITRSYGGHAANEASRRLSNLESIGGVGAFLRNGAGQTWYLLVAPLGILLAAASTFRPARLRRRRVSAAELVLALGGLAGLGLLVESALSFRTIDRPDMLVYGRYTDVVVPPLLALALARLGAGRRVRTAAAVTAIVAATGVAVLLRASVQPDGLANRWNVASLPSPTFQLGPKVLLAAGLAALIALIAVIAAQRRNPAAVAPLVLLLFVPTTAVIERNPVLTAQSAFYPSGWSSPAAAARGARSVAFDTDSTGSVFVYQWFVANARLVLFSGSSAPPPSRFVISSPEWAAAHRGLHPTPLWDDRGRGVELFRVRLRR